MRVQNWRCDARLVRKWIRASGKMVEWLESKGFVFATVDTFSAHQGIKGYHVIPGFYTHQGPHLGEMLIECLSSDLEGVEIMKNTRGTKLLTNENGDVIGALASDVKDGTEYKINAKAVIIATGNIGGNRELIKKFFPYEDYSTTGVASGWEHNSGDGYFMALEVGAKETPIAAYRLAGSHANPRVGLLSGRPEPMEVNKHGERFTNESLSAYEPFWWFANESVHAQPFKTSYIIYDQEILDKVVVSRKPLRGSEASHAQVGITVKEGGDGLDGFDHIIEDVKKAAEEGKIGKFQTLEECAEYIGCDESVLKATVERYNGFCERGYDDEFLKLEEYLLPIKTPPFYVIPGFPGVDTFLGGIKVDHNQRVLREDWTPINGLYAVGTGTGGWLNTGYGYPGTCFGYSIYSGYTAGGNAAEYAAKLK
jgi:fumarate reductase flavoprotein subunit